MAYLLDTDILSAIRRKQRDINLEKWFGGNRTAEMYLSVVTIGEIERGITRQKSVDPGFALSLTQWLETIITHYDPRILPLTANIARRWGQLSGELGHNGADLMIAATALEHNLTVVTRNSRHFEPAKVNLINPFLTV